MFIDYTKIHVKAGDGGQGAVSFHTEKYVPNGGPDGGDGGRGGDVVFVADGGIHTLRDIRYRRKYVAEHGERGGTRKRTGRSGRELVIRVPVGTVLRELQTGRVFADFAQDGERVVVAHGGRAGRGNARFANAVRQAPRFARVGEPGEEWDLEVELKLLADVGLVGMPNVGKSTLLAAVSSARPKIAHYPFTTLEPSLGLVAIDDTEFVMADIPGLIAGAHEGVGLGLDFLRHIERNKMLLHVIDVSGSEGRDPIEDFEQIGRELELFNPRLRERPQIVVANKSDIAEPGQVDRVRQELTARGYAFMPISAATGQGVRKLLRLIARMLPEIPAPVLFDEEAFFPVYTADPAELFTVEAREDGYRVAGAWIEQLVASTNFDNYESLQYFQRLIRRKGVIDALEQAGVREGDTVDLGGFEFEYFH